MCYHLSASVLAMLITSGCFSVYSFMHNMRAFILVEESLVFSFTHHPPCGEVVLEAANSTCLWEKPTRATILYVSRFRVHCYRATRVVCEMFRGNQTNSSISFTSYWCHLNSNGGFLATLLSCQEGPGLHWCSWRGPALESPGDRHTVPERNVVT